MDHFSTTALGEIDWTLILVWRLLSISIVLLLMFQMVLLLSHYWHWVMPLRREIRDGDIIAPPVVWTFLFHISVTLILALVGLGLAQAIHFQSKVTALTIFGPLTLGFHSLVVNRFLKYYGRSLRHGRDQLRRQRSTCPDPRDSA